MAAGALDRSVAGFAIGASFGGRGPRPRRTWGLRIMLYAILFVGSLGTDASAMEPRVAFGPFETLRQCAAAGALGINELNGKHPDKDFRIDCSPTNEIKRRPGAVL